MKTLFFSLLLTVTALVGHSSAEPVFRKAKFSGLLGDGVQDPTKRGLIDAVTNPQRDITAKVKRKGRPISFKGRVEANGQLDKEYKVKIFGHVVASFHVTLQFSEDGNTITGTVEEDGETQSFTLTRAIYSNAEPTQIAGTFAAFLPPAGGDFPGGTGFAAVKISPTGTVTMKGKLADGTAFSSATPLVVDNKVVVFALLYKQQGGIVGVLSFGGSIDRASGTLRWIRLEDAKPDTIEPSEYDGDITMDLFRYNKPEAHTAALPGLDSEGNATLSLSGGNLTATFVSNVKVNSKSKVAVPSPNAEKLSVKITPATGLVSGKAKVELAGGSKKVSFYGIISTDPTSPYARGFFVGDDKAGNLVFQATP